VSVLVVVVVSVLVAGATTVVMDGGRGGGGGATAGVARAVFFCFRKKLRRELIGPLGACPQRGALHALFAGGVAP
jgi:hypothetical protein